MDKKMDRKKFEQLELEIAKDILKDIIMLTNEDTGEVYCKRHGVYEKIPEPRLTSMVVDAYLDNDCKYSRAKKNVTFDFLKSLTIENTKRIEESNNNTINLSNGVYFLNEDFEQLHVNNETKERWTTRTNFIHHGMDRPELKNYISFNQLPIKYIPEATCPIIDKFMIDVFGKEHVDEIYEFIGYVLLPHVRYQRALMMIGSGKNGKSTFIDMILRFLGINNVSQITLQELEGKFAMINIRNKMLNVVGDLPTKPIEDTGNAKRIVTDNVLSGSIKNIQGNFNFNNRCKMMYSVNELPRTKDSTTAFFRRWIIKFCDSVFDGKNKDVFILDKLTTDEEMSGLFNQCLKGIERLELNNGFPDNELEVKRIWDLDTNPIAEFVQNKCNIISGIETSSQHIFPAVNEYRKSKGDYLLKNNSIGYWLRVYGIIGKQRQVDGKYFTFYQDIELIDKEELDIEGLEWMLK